MIDFSRIVGIEGWMSVPELEWLAKAAGKAQRIVEVGCWHGRTTRALALHTAGLVIAVDTWEGTPGDPETQRAFYSGAVQARAAFDRNVADLRNVHPLQMQSVTAASLLRDLDLVFIDADHAYEAVRADIVAWSKALRRGAILCGHDYGAADGVTLAVDELLGESAVRGPGEIPGSLWAHLIR